MNGCVLGEAPYIFQIICFINISGRVELWRFEQQQRLCWCDPGLWGLSTGWSSQGDLGWTGPLSLIISQSSSHIINISSWQEVAGHPMLSCHIFPLLRYLWALMVLPAWPGIEQIFFYQVAELLESRGENWWTSIKLPFPLKPRVPMSHLHQHQFQIFVQEPGTSPCLW